jgi:uncharacterized protein (TIGR02246 family)
VTFLAAALLLGSCAGVQVPSAPIALEQEIIAVERARLKAFRDNDRVAFAAMTTDDLAMVHSDGSVLNKAQEISVMRASTPDRPLPTLDIEDVRVHGSADVAVITGSLVERQAERLVLRLRFTNVYLRRAGRWLLAAGQLTRARTD